MKVAIISDIHANLEALDAFRESYDELWVLGDLVNYGANPGEAIEWVREHASVIVRGNHDYLVGFHEYSQRSERFREMAKYTEGALSAEQMRFLQQLPDYKRRQIGNTVFFLCHATPSNLLFEYRQADSPQWEIEARAIGADVVLVGHTHLPFARSFGTSSVANPGSLGQSRAGDPKARYATWEDGRIELKSFSYPVETTIAKIERLRIGENVKQDLVAVLRTGIVHRGRDGSPRQFL
jgi:putative phosphoesterase